MNLDLAYTIAAIVLLLLAAIGYVRAVKRGDEIQRWLEATDERLEREIRQARPWSLPAAKGVKKPDRWVH